jgi:hypothetical protein
VAEHRVVLLRAEKPFWLVDAVIREGELTVCSGDAQREWHVIVAAAERLPLLHALRARCGRQALPGEAPERETLELLAQAFSGPHRAPRGDQGLPQRGRHPLPDHRLVA